MMIVVISLSGISPIIINALPEPDAINYVNPILVTFGDSYEEKQAINQFMKNYPNTDVFNFDQASEIIEITTNPIIYVGHSSYSGIEYNNDILSWKSLAKIITSSNSDNHFILGCDSQTISMLTENTHKNVISFDSKIDALIGVSYISMNIANIEGLGNDYMFQFYNQYTERTNEINNNPSVEMLMPVFSQGEGGGGGGGSTTSPPTAPNSLEHSIYYNLIDLSWDPPSDLGGAYAVIYELYRSSSKYGTYDRIHILEDTYISVTQEFSTTFYYKVKAVTVYGSSSYSNRVTVTTGSDPNNSNCDLFMVNDPTACTGLSSGEFTIHAIIALLLLASFVAPIWAATYGSKLANLVHTAVHVATGARLLAGLLITLSTFLMVLDNYDNSGSEWQLVSQLVGVGMEFVAVIGLYHLHMAAVDIAGSTTLILLDKGGLVNPAAWAILIAIYIAIFITATAEIHLFLVDWND